MNKSFLMRMALVFFLLAVACGVAGYASRTFWLAAFESLKYGITDFAALDAENQTMKIPMNLVMYVMPVGFGCAGVGLLAASALAYCLGVLDGVMTYFSCRSGRKDGQHA